MASISKLKTGRKRYRVRWRQPNASQTEKRFHSRKEAEAFRREVEDTRSKGANVPMKETIINLEDCIGDYFSTKRNKWKESTYKQKVQYLSQFVEWYDRTENAYPDLRVLSDRLLLRFHHWLMSKDNPCSEGTAYARVRHIEHFWQWAYNREEYHSHCPNPVKAEIREVVTQRVFDFPTWKDLDKAILSSQGWYRQVMIILRYTGLRVGQVMRLKWDDINLKTRRLTFRGKLGKTRQEERGRAFYLSPHLLAHLRAWPKESEWIVDRRLIHKGRKPSNNDNRNITCNRIPKEIWQRTDVPSYLYRQSFHCFRKAVNQGLMELGAQDSIRKYMLGHHTDVNESVYLSVRILLNKTSEVAALFPPLTVDIENGELFTQSENATPPHQ